MFIDEAGGISEEEAAFTPRGGEPTVYAFNPEKIEDAERFYYMANESQVIYPLVVSGEALKFPDLIATVAGQLAFAWNQNAKVPGVLQVSANQEAQPAGNLIDVFDVYVSSTSGLTQGLVQVQGQDVRPDLFAKLIGAERATLDKYEGR